MEGGEEGKTERSGTGPAMAPQGRAGRGGADHGHRGDRTAPPPTGTPNQLLSFLTALRARLRPIGPRSSPAPSLITANQPQPPRPCGGAGPYKALTGEVSAIAARPAPAMEEPLALLVRSPAQRHRDLRLSAQPAWTVRRLKTELRRLLPDAPVSAQSALPAALPGAPCAQPGWVGGGGCLAPRGVGRQLRGAAGPVRVPRAVPVASAALEARLGYFGAVRGPAVVNHYPPARPARPAGVRGRQSPLAPGSRARAPRPAGGRDLGGALRARSRCEREARRCVGLECRSVPSPGHTRADA